jgi:hypothetical protein
VSSNNAVPLWRNEELQQPQQSQRVAEERFPFFVKPHPFEIVLTSTIERDSKNEHRNICTQLSLVKEKGLVDPLKNRLMLSQQSYETPANKKWWQADWDNLTRSLHKVRKPADLLRLIARYAKWRQQESLLVHLAKTPASDWLTRQAPEIPLSYLKASIEPSFSLWGQATKSSLTSVRRDGRIKTSGSLPADMLIYLAEIKLLQSLVFPEMESGVKQEAHFNLVNQPEAKKIKIHLCLPDQMDDAAEPFEASQIKHTDRRWYGGFGMLEYLHTCGLFGYFPPSPLAGKTTDEERLRMIAMFSQVTKKHPLIDMPFARQGEGGEIKPYYPRQGAIRHQQPDLDLITRWCHSQEKISQETLMKAIRKGELYSGGYLDNKEGWVAENLYLSLKKSDSAKQLSAPQSLGVYRRISMHNASKTLKDSAIFDDEGLYFGEVNPRQSIVWFTRTVFDVWAFHELQQALTIAKLPCSQSPCLATFTGKGLAQILQNTLDLAIDTDAQPPNISVITDAKTETTPVEADALYRLTRWFNETLLAFAYDGTHEGQVALEKVRQLMQLCHIDPKTLSVQTLTGFSTLNACLKEGSLTTSNEKELLLHQGNIDDWLHQMRLRVDVDPSNGQMELYRVSKRIHTVPFSRLSIEDKQKWRVHVKERMQNKWGVAGFGCAYDGTGEGRQLNRTLKHLCELFELPCAQWEVAQDSSNEHPVSHHGVLKQIRQSGGAKEGNGLLRDYAKAYQPSTLLKGTETNTYG